MGRDIDAAALVVAHTPVDGLGEEGGRGYRLEGVDDAQILGLHHAHGVVVLDGDVLGERLGAAIRGRGIAPWRRAAGDLRAQRAAEIGVESRAGEADAGKRQGSVGDDVVRLVVARDIQRSGAVDRIAAGATVDVVD